MTRYEKGFIEKCAEYGVDGRELLKRAQLTPEEHLEFRKLKGLTTDNADVLYKEYRKKRRLAKIMSTVLLGLYGTAVGADSDNDGAGALIGGGVGALAGYGLGSLGTSLTDAAVRNNINNNKAGKPASWWAMTNGI